MKSPFPGMDPYLERYWGDVHATLIVYSRDFLQPRLPDDLLARIEQRVFLEYDDARIRSLVPDLRISETYPEPGTPPATLREGDAAVAEPLVFELDEVEIAQRYLEIREGDGGKVVTVIEFLSPANKRGGEGQDKYLQKQAEVAESDASLVEIDLTRAGRRVLALPSNDIPPAHRLDYLACISPGWQRRRRELYPMPLRQRLPLLPVPLRQHEPRVHLDLQAVVNQAYAAGRYHHLDYRVELDPPLPPEDAAWAAALLRAAGGS
jgi:hypothetical protein